jgi:hypothetical protein
MWRGAPRPGRPSVNSTRPEREHNVQNRQQNRQVKNELRTWSGRRESNPRMQRWMKRLVLSGSSIQSMSAGSVWDATRASIDDELPSVRRLSREACRSGERGWWRGRARSQDRGRAALRVGCVKRSRCCSRTSSAFSSSTVYVYEAQTVRAMSSSSQPPPRTFARWPS